MTYKTFEELTISEEPNDDINKKIDPKESSLSSKRFLNFNYDNSQFILISLLSIGSVCFGIAYSMQSPFFPSECKSRDIDENWIGIISGILDLGFTTGSILSGKMSSRFKSKNVITSSLLLGGFSLILFGSLQWFHNSLQFKAIAVILRILMGLGMGTFFTSCFAIIFLDFSDSLSKVYAIIEMCYAIGLIVGPVVGGMLYELGGYFGYRLSLPFLVLGLFQLGVGITGYKFIQTKGNHSEEKGSFGQLLSNFPITLNAIIYFNAGALLGFNTSTLELHLNDITHLTPSVKGLIFFISGITYALLNHFWSNLSESLNDCYRISLIGCVSSLICFVCVGPIPGLPINPNIYLVVISQVFLGIGVSAILVGSFVQGFNETIKLGYSDSPSTAAIMSSLFTTSESMGYAVSPIVGGYVMESHGFRWATLPLIIFQILLILAIISFGLLKRH